MPTPSCPAVRWDELPDAVRLPFSPDEVDLGLGHGVEWGLALPDGDRTLEGVAVLASGARWAVPRGLCVEVASHRLPIDDGHAVDRPPAWLALSGPPIPTSVRALAAEVATSWQGEHAPALEELLVELLANAAAHRSYEGEQLGTPTKLEVFTDAIRLWSPGAPVARIARSGRWFTGCRLRNPTLASALREVGLVRLKGHSARGIQGMARAAGTELLLDTDGDGVETVLRTRTQESEVEPRGAGARERRQIILAAMRGRSWLTSREIAQLAEQPGSSTRRTLKALVDEGLVDRERSGHSAPNQRYRVARSR